MIISSVGLQVPYRMVSTRLVATTLSGDPTVGPLELIPRNDSHQRSQVSVVVGSTVSVNFTAKFSDSSQSISIYVLEDPGVPNVQNSNEGVRPQVCLNSACNSAVRQLVWSPFKGQEGMVHSICVLAIPSSSRSCQSIPLCIDIEVLTPNISFDASVTPLPETMFHTPVGCTLEVCFQAYDANHLYSVDLQPVQGSFPPDAQFDQQCSQIAVTWASQLYSPLFPPSVQALSQLYAPIPCMRCLRWEAQRGMETQSFRPCVTAFDQSATNASNALASLNTCITLFVPKCKYCVQAGDTLHYINKKFQLNTNWLQLWNANGMPEINPDPLAPAVVIGDPDWIADANSIINLGPIYRVQPGETLQQLAALFRTTVKKLLDVNPDVAAAPTLAASATLCVMPCTDASYTMPA